MQFLFGTLNSGTGSVDQDASFTELFEGAVSAIVVYAGASRTGSTSTSVGWADVSNNASPVTYYHNPIAIAFNIIASGGASPATLSSATPSGTLGTTTSATLGATTDQTTGTFYGVVDTAGNISGITAAQVKAGQNNASASAVSASSTAVSTTSPATAVSGLTAATAYSYAVVQNNVNGDSNVLTGTFTTAAAATNLEARNFGPTRALRTLLTM